MRSLFHVLSVLAVMGMVFWAYRETYATKQALRDSDVLQREIAVLRETMAVQRAEWAYLNRPDRLAELAVANYDQLGLMPMLPEQFLAIRDVPLPRPEVFPEGLINPQRFGVPVDVIAAEEDPL